MYKHSCDYTASMENRRQQTLNLFSAKLTVPGKNSENGLSHYPAFAENKMKFDQILAFITDFEQEAKAMVKES